MAINPTGADLKRYLAEDPGGPVVMLNLLRFTGDAGRESYRQYLRALEDYAPTVGAEVVYVGDTSTVLVGAEGHEWDVVLLVRYPSREAFSRMVADPDYQAVTHLRTDALEAAVLEATVPWPAG